MTTIKDTALDDGTSAGMGRIGCLTTVITVLFFDAAGLPEPGSMTVYGVLDGHVHDQIVLQFPPVAESTDAVTEWANRFGGVVQSTPLKDDKHGRTQYVRAEFTYAEWLSVKVFTVFPLLETEAIASAEQDSEPETALPF
ncbi:MAG TPA: hypothetical protein VMA73_14615 [Streptosporangiaceae bacterium]|nr:hypothetical protein [Streptosporangiaceae bacterium]